MDGEVVVSKSGATSTKLEERWDLIPFSALAAMARRFWYGSVKHAARNWERGDAEFAETRLSHCFRHMSLFAEFRRQEDLDAVLCNAAMLAWFKEQGLMPERMKDHIKVASKQEQVLIERQYAVPSNFTCKHLVLGDCPLCAQEVRAAVLQGAIHEP
jgi:hypothetical protein